MRKYSTIHRICVISLEFRIYFLRSFWYENFDLRNLAFKINFLRNSLEGEKLISFNPVATLCLSSLSSITWLTKHRQCKHTTSVFDFQSFRVLFIFPINTFDIRRLHTRFSLLARLLLFLFSLSISSYLFFSFTILVVYFSLLNDFLAFFHPQFQIGYLFNDIGMELGVTIQTHPNSMKRARARMRLPKPDTVYLTWTSRVPIFNSKELFNSIWPHSLHRRNRYILRKIITEIQKVSVSHTHTHAHAREYFRQIHNIGD